MSMYGAAAAKSQNDNASCSWRISAIATVFDTMPVTFEAAENDPIRSGRSAYSSKVLAQPVEVDVAVGVLRDRDDVGDRLAPRHLVGVVLVGTDEHDRPFRAGMCALSS